MWVFFYRDAKVVNRNEFIDKNLLSFCIHECSLGSLPNGSGRKL